MGFCSILTMTYILEIYFKVSLKSLGLLDVKPRECPKFIKERIRTTTSIPEW